MDEEHPRETQPRRRSRKKIFILVAVLAVMGGGVWLLLLPHEPSYNGKKLSYWLKRYAKNSNPESPEFIESRDAVRHIGTNAIPTLLRMLRAKDSALKLKLIELIEKQHYFEFNFVSDDELHYLALEGFACLGNRAVSAVPALVDIYKKSPAGWSKRFVDRALMDIYPAGGTAIPYWVPPQERAVWYYGAGLIKFESSDNSNAILAYSESIKLSPTNVSAYLARGSAELQLEDFRGALGDMEKTIGLNSSNQAAFYLAGACKFALKDFQGAEDTLTTAIRLDTNDWSSYNYRGQARISLRKLDEAVVDFNKAIELSPREASLYGNRALAEGTLKDYELALADVSKSIDLNGKDARAYLLRGRIKNSLKEYKAALVDFDKSIELDPKDPSPLVYRASAKLHLNELESTDADIGAALRLNPKMPLAYLMRGILKTKRGEPADAALADFEHALELSPQSPEVFGVLGLFQYKFSRRAEALVNCRKALELHTTANAGELRAFVWIMRAQAGEESEANRELEAYLKSLPAGKTNDWEASIARFLSGSVTESDLLAQATTTAKRPSAVSGQVCDSYYYAAMKRKLAGDKPGARELFQKCLDTKEEHNYGYINAVVEMRGEK